MMHENFKFSDMHGNPSKIELNGEKGCLKCSVPCIFSVFHFVCVRGDFGHAKTQKFGKRSRLSPISMHFLIERCYSIKKYVVYVWYVCISIYSNIRILEYTRSILGNTAFLLGTTFSGDAFG